MKLVVILAVSATFPCCTAATSARQDSHPVEAVIQLLQGLLQKVDSEGKAEALTYAKFETWCTNSERTLKDAIGEETADVDELTSTVAAKTEEIASLGTQITTLQGELSQMALAASESASQRKAAAALYTEADKAQQLTIAAIKSAVEALQAAATSTGGLLLAQQRVREAMPLASAAATTEQRELLAGFVDGADPEPLKAAGDYESHIKKYSFKSRNVIELLNELKAKFEDERLEGTKAETNAINSYELQKSAAQAAASATTSSEQAKTSQQSNAATEKVAADSSLGQVTSSLQADSNALVATQQQCSVKSSEWAERSRTRSQEAESIKAAIDILAKVTGVRVAAPSNPILPSPVSRGTALFQAGKADDPRAKAVELLRAEARAVHSKALERLVQEVAVHIDGPFDQVKNMIQKMVFHLMDEQKDEDTHKNWCDLELNKTEASMQNKALKLQELKAQIDEATAGSQLLAVESEAAQKLLNVISAHVAEATDIRETGKRENALAIKDSEDAQTALTNAIGVLEAFYKDSGMIAKQPWEFVQRGVTLPDEPSTWAAGYTGVADPNGGGIVAVLTKISASFSTMEAETRAQEESDSKAFDEEVKACAIEKSRLSAEVEEKGQEQRRLVAKVATLSSTHKQISIEHEATQQYLKDLQPACVEGDSTYEDRKAARIGEMDALKEAEGILAKAFEEAATEPTSFLQRRLPAGSRASRLA